jgi:hypothetical protein
MQFKDLIPVGGREVRTWFSSGFNGYVKENRCLIVLLNVTTIEEWDQIKKCFKTTREEVVY